MRKEDHEDIETYDKLKDYLNSKITFLKIKNIIKN